LQQVTLTLRYIWIVTKYWLGVIYQRRPSVLALVVQYGLPKRKKMFSGQKNVYSGQKNVFSGRPVDGTPPVQGRPLWPTPPLSFRPDVFDGWRLISIKTSIHLSQICKCVYFIEWLKQTARVIQMLVTQDISSCLVDVFSWIARMKHGTAVDR